MCKPLNDKMGPFIVEYDKEEPVAIFMFTNDMKEYTYNLKLSEKFVILKSESDYIHINRISGNGSFTFLDIYGKPTKNRYFYNCNKWDGQKKF